MKDKISFLTLAVALVALVLPFFHKAPSAEKRAANDKTAFTRVMRTRTLRCGYSVWAPYFMIDPNTKQMSGIDYDIMEAIGKAANLKIDWAEEVGFGSFPEALSVGKQDAFCVTVWVSAARAERVTLTDPVDFVPLYAYVRDGDSRFDGNPTSIDDEKVTIAVIDGSTQKAVADMSFPHARQYALPGDTDGSQILMAVGTGKGDVVFADEFIVHDYNAHNADKQLRRIGGMGPVRIFGDAFSVGKGETGLVDVLNAAIQELYGNGTIDRILSKYETSPGAILRAALPYAKIPLQQGGRS